MKTKILLSNLFLLSCFLSAFALPTPGNIDITVAQDSSGDYSTIQEAIDASPSSSSTYTLIYIKNGTYEETLNIPSAKKKLILYGEEESGVIITYATEETLDLATIELYATEFIAYNLTIVNTAGSTYGPAQALRQEVDKSIWVNCKFIGNQDTFRNKAGRAYFKNCYFEGTVDFIFGAGTCVFEDCDIYSKGGSAITAASTKEYVTYGYVFRNCRVTAKEGTTTRLGRPWKDYAAVAFINCELPRQIISDGWSNWDDEDKEETARYAEYMNYGPGADPESRVNWATMLTEEEASAYATLNVFKTTYSSSPTVDNWNPYKILSNTGIVNLRMEGDGYGMNEGGNGGTEVSVADEATLRSYALSNDKYIISIYDTIELTQSLNLGANTTLIGIDENSSIKGNSIFVSDTTENVIIKYLNISNENGNGILIKGGKNAFISHVSFYDCTNEFCKISDSSDSVTISWCRFYYSNQDNSNSALITYGSSSDNKLHITLHHNWWYKNVNSNMPDASNAMAHIYNNYWNCINNTSCSNAQAGTEFKSEYNYYNNVNNPCLFESDGKIFTNENVYNNCSGTASNATESVFDPEYPYMLSEVDYVPEIVTSRAGNIWKEPATYTLNIEKTSGGSISPSGSKTYNEGYLASAEATSRSGYIFSNWTGDINSDSSYIYFYMNQDYEITANFSEIEEDTTSTIEQSSNVNTYTIYPNPSKNNSIYIDLNDSPEGFYNKCIYNLQGAIIYKTTSLYSGNTIKINPILTPGLYYIALNTKNVNLRNKLIIE